MPCEASLKKNGACQGQGIAEPSNLINNKLGKTTRERNLQKYGLMQGAFLGFTSTMTLHFVTYLLYACISLWPPYCEFNFIIFIPVVPKSLKSNLDSDLLSLFQQAPPALQCCTPFSLKLVCSSLGFIAMALSVRERSANIWGPSMEIYNWHIGIIGKYNVFALKIIQFVWNPMKW